MGILIRSFCIMQCSRNITSVRTFDVISDKFEIYCHDFRVTIDGVRIDNLIHYTFIPYYTSQITIGNIRSSQTAVSSPVVAW
jgi:hypothetical protein